MSSGRKYQRKRNYNIVKKRYRVRNRRFRKLKLDGGIFELKQKYDLSSDTLGVLADYFSTSSPSRVVNGVSTYNDWTELQSMYDNFQLLGFKMQYIPHVPNDTSQFTGYAPYYIVHDNNQGGSAMLSSNEALEYGNLVVKNLYKPFTYKKKISTKNQTLPASAIVAMINGNIFYKTTTSPDTSCVRTYADGLDASTTYGTVILSVIVRCRNRV